MSQHYDALVVGSGPAGSVAALVLARGGATVALVDKARFPRDKACGDLVGPRGVQTLADLGIGLQGAHLGDMEVVGPSGRKVLLPATEGLTYPGHAVAVPRSEFDDLLHRAAVEAGAVGITGRADAPLYRETGTLEGFEIRAEGAGAIRVTADVVVGADGALSRVGAAAGLVDEQKALWGFAIRGYVESASGSVAGPVIDLPRIHFWEPTPWSGYPGYGWVFPSGRGVTNAGLGVAARGNRRSAGRAVRDLPCFLRDVGLEPDRMGPTLGGWLKMGLVGTVAGSGQVLLVGDAAGLVNPLQGEGIAQALDSGRFAAEAILKAGPGSAASFYRDEIRSKYGPFAATTGSVTTWMIEHPKGVAAAGRLLTARGLGSAVAGGWALYWNDLVEGASRNRSRSVARLAGVVGRALTAGAAVRRDIESGFATSAPDA